MDKIAIGYFADGPWSHKAFQLLNSDSSIAIKFIVPRSDTQDDTLKIFSQENNIDYLIGERINSKSFYEKAKSYECDLFVSMSFNQIFKHDIINLPKLKTINCHAGNLPYYRGRNVLNWVLINDENEFGITVHYMDEGIDTGDIILQRMFPIADADNYATLLDVAYDECAKILYDAVKLIQNNTQERIPQETIHPVGFYCGKRGIGDEIIDWNQKSRDVFNFIRAICEPGPQARSYCNGKEIYINKADLIENAPEYRSTIGQIVGKGEGFLTVKTLDSTIKIVDYTYDGSLKIGDRFTANKHG